MSALEDSIPTAAPTAAASEPISESFKPAPVRGSINWKIDGDILSKNGKPQVNLTEVTGRKWMRMQHRGTVSRSLKLKSPNGTATINVGTFGEAPGQARMKRISIMALARVSETSPNALFHVAGGLGMIIMLFTLGLMLLGLGVFCLAIGFSEPHAVPVIMGLVFLPMGAWLGWNSRPWNNDRFKVPAAAAIMAVLQG